MSSKTFKDLDGDVLTIEPETVYGHAAFSVSVPTGLVDLSIEHAEELVKFLQEGIAESKKALAQRELGNAPEGFENGATVAHKDAPNDRGILLHRYVRHPAILDAYAVWLVGWEVDGKPVGEQEPCPRTYWHNEETLVLVEK